MVEDPRLLTLNPVWEQDPLRGKLDAAQGKPPRAGGRERAITDMAAALDTLQKEMETLKAILEAGGTVLTGTDSPLDNVATALHLSLRAQVKYGIEPWRALQTATYLPAKAFGVLADLGTIEPGKIADIALVAGDPLREIKDVTNVKFVMKDGRLFSQEELSEPFVHKTDSKH